LDDAVAPPPGPVGGSSDLLVEVPANPQLPDGPRGAGAPPVFTDPAPLGGLDNSAPPQNEPGGGEQYESSGSGVYGPMGGGISTWDAESLLDWDLSVRKSLMGWYDLG
jgi:hypothetical protein